MAKPKPIVPDNFPPPIAFDATLDRLRISADGAVLTISLPLGSQTPAAIHQLARLYGAGSLAVAITIEPLQTSMDL